MLVASKIKSKGQVTVPLLIRSKLNINTGDTVLFEVRDDEIIIRKPKNLLDYEGFIKVDQFSPEAEEAAIEEAAVARYLGENKC